VSRQRVCTLLGLLLTLAGAGYIGGPPQAAIAAATAASGQGMPVGDLPGWRQIFRDDFTTDVPQGAFPGALAGRWGAYPYPARDTYSGTYWPQKVISVHDGFMDLFLHSENGVHLSAAPTPRLPGASSGNGILYGRYAVRFRADPVPGYKTAWLLWPDSGAWPRDGEIDFPEAGLDDPICAFMHRMGGAGQDVYCTGATYPTWHTAVIEWTPQRLTFILDDRVVGNATSNIPNTPMHWVLQTETNKVPPDNAAAGHVQIAWVAVYRPDAGARSAPVAPVVPAPPAVIAAPPPPPPPDWNSLPITAKHQAWFDAHMAQTQRLSRNEPAAIVQASPSWPQVLGQLQGNVRELAAVVVVDVLKRGLELGMDAVRQGAQHVGDLVYRAFHISGR
jgi:hypothetical protein